MLSPKENSPLAVRRTQSSASRAIRNRQAQRMFRQRQDSRLEQLRQSASGLSVQLSQLTHRMRRRILDDECEIENIKQAIERLRSLDGDGICADCVACIAGPANLMPTHPNSADGRHGPLQVTSYVNAFSNLPSLRGSRLPHELMDAIRMFSKSGDPASAKRRFAQFFKVRRKLLDCCSVVDRQMAIEIIEQFKTDNKDHVAVMYELSYADGDIPIPADSFRDDELGFVVGGESQLKCMLEALLKIESLSHHRDLINELLIQLQMYKEGKERANGFLRITEIRMKLRNLCTTADECSRLMLALELGKAF